MIEIKNIIFTKCKMNFLKAIFCFVNHLLPLRLKYLNESFVILNDNHEEGLITLDKDSKSYKRFKITKLFLEENSTFLAKQLVNYVISRYRAMGANSFYVVIDEKQADLLNIFKNELNFRNCGYEFLYKVNSLDTQTNITLKSFKKENVKEVTAFYNSNINSFNKVVFAREEAQFFNNCYKYIFYNEDNSKIIGYFEVATKNMHDFYINFSIDFAYNVYLIDAIRFIYSLFKHKVKTFDMYIKVKEYFLNSKELNAILNENNFELISKNQILAKDYYREIKQNDLFKNTRIIFNDPTLA